MTQPALLASWIRSTILGWALGVPAIVLFSALAESLGRQSLQTPVGAGMGLTVGFFQSRAIRARLGRHGASSWFWSSFVGLASPFLAADLARLAGITVPYSLYLAVVCGGLVVGVWQAALLSPSVGRADPWVAASVLGWVLASGSVALADDVVRAKDITGIPGALAYLCLVASGGVLLAVSTGVVLVRLLRSQSAA